MKGGRSMVLGLFIGLALCAGLVTTAAAEDPGLPFWSMYVGNWWQYDGSDGVGGTWTIHEEVVSSDTTTIPGVKTYHVEHQEDGEHEADSYYELGLAEIKVWRERFIVEIEEVEYWVTVTVVDENGGIVIGKNPIVVPDTWITTRTGTVDIEVFDTGTPFYSGPANITSTIDVQAQETVVTPLGTYQAYKVEDIMRVVDPTGLNFPTLERTQYNWWVPYIGNIQWQNL